MFLASSGSATTEFCVRGGAPVNASLEMKQNKVRGLTHFDIVMQ